MAPATAQEHAHDPEDDSIAPAAAKPEEDSDVGFQEEGKEPENDAAASKTAEELDIDPEKRQMKLRARRRTPATAKPEKGFRC